MCVCTHTHTHTHRHTQKGKEKKNIWQFPVMKDRLKLTNLGCYYTWEFSKVGARVSKDGNWPIL